MTEARKTAASRRRRPERLIDPYVVTPHTWTREELMRARGESRRRPTSTHPRRAA